MAHIRMKRYGRKKLYFIKNGIIQRDYRVWSYGNKGTFTQRTNYIELSVNYGIYDGSYNMSNIIFNKQINWTTYKKIYVRWANGNYRARQLNCKTTSNYSLQKANINGGETSETNNLINESIIVNDYGNNTIVETSLNIVNPNNNFPYLFLGLLRDDRNFNYQGDPSTIKIYDVYIES